jgi:hypothetical protein
MALSSDFIGKDVFAECQKHSAKRSTRQNVNRKKSKKMKQEKKFIGGGMHTNNSIYHYTIGPSVSLRFYSPHIIINRI